eukprot:5154586-Pyramimonas_sp.AAC.2
MDPPSEPPLWPGTALDFCREKFPEAPPGWCEALLPAKTPASWHYDRCDSDRYQPEDTHPPPHTLPPGAIPRNPNHTLIHTLNCIGATQTWTYAWTHPRLHLRPPLCPGPHRSRTHTLPEPSRHVLLFEPANRSCILKRAPALPLLIGASRPPPTGLVGQSVESANEPSTRLVLSSPSMRQNEHASSNGLPSI